MSSFLTNRISTREWTSVQYAHVGSENEETETLLLPTVTLKVRSCSVSLWARRLFVVGSNSRELTSRLLPLIICCCRVKAPTVRLYHDSPSLGLYFTFVQHPSYNSRCETLTECVYRVHIRECKSLWRGHDTPDRLYDLCRCTEWKPEAGVEVRRVEGGRKWGD